MARAAAGADDVAEVIPGIEERGAFERCEAVLSGYQGAEDVGAVVLDAVARVKAATRRRSTAATR